MRLDRSLQRKLLDLLAAQYPRSVDPTEFVNGLGAELETAYAANAAYLREHGLIEGALTISGDGFVSLYEANITARGLDFLADDGGLTAILGVVTVKLHADTIRDLLLAKAESAALPAAEKSALKKHLAALPSEALKEAAKQLVHTGMEHLPDAVQWLRTVAGL